MRRLLCMLALVLAVPSCHATRFPAGSPPRAESEGEVFVYLHPLPQEADGLSFRLAELQLERADGGSVPLSLRLTKIDRGEPGRERLLARGAVPPGAFVGLSLRADQATLRGEQGEGALQVSEEATAIPFPFAVERQEAAVVKLRLNYGDSVRNGFRFTPVFHASVPRRGILAAGRIGLSTARGANAVTVFDKVSGQVVSVLLTGDAPVGVVIDPVRRRAYVSLSGEDALEAIDLLELRVLERLRLAGGDVPLDLALSADGRTLLVANSGSNTVSFVDALALLETDRVAVGAAPQSILLDGTGRRAYVFNALSDTISVLDIPRASVAGTISTESGPIRGGLSRDGRRLFVLQRGSPYLGVVDTGSLAVARGAYVGTGAKALKVDAQTDWIYVGPAGSAGVEVYDPSALLPVDAVPAGGEAAYLAIDGEENNLWIVLPGSDRLLAVGLVNKRAAAAVDVGAEPTRVTVMGER